MADNNDKILKALAKQGKALANQGKALANQGKALANLQADVSSIKTGHGKKLDRLQSDVSIIKDDTSHIHTVLKILPTKQDVEALKVELEGKIKAQQRPR